jgi:hypothetical protein
VPQAAPILPLRAYKVKHTQQYDYFAPQRRPKLVWQRTSSESDGTLVAQQSACCMPSRTCCGSTTRIEYHSHHSLFTGALHPDVLACSGPSCIAVAGVSRPVRHR